MNENENEKSHVSHVFYLTQTEDEEGFKNNNENEKLRNSNSSEVEDLKYRISQLEHLVISTSLSSPNETSESLNLTHEKKLSQRVNDLESLLAASELDNQNLEKQLKIQVGSENNLKLLAWEALREKDTEIENEKENNRLLNVKLEKLSQKYKTMESYLVTLPSIQELQELQNKNAELEAQNEYYKFKLNETLNLSHDLKEKLNVTQTELSKSSQRLKVLEPLETAQQEFLSSSSPASSPPQLQELILAQRTSLLRSRQIITNYKSQLLSQSNEILTLNSRLTSAGEELEKSGQSSHLLSLQLNSLVSQLQAKEEREIELEKLVDEMRKRLGEQESVLEIRSEEVFNLLKLVAELNVSVEELRVLVRILNSVREGEEIELDLIVEDFGENQIEIESLEEVDREWFLEKLKIVRGVREDLRKLRKGLADYYAQEIGVGTNCSVQ